MTIGWDEPPESPVERICQNCHQWLYIDKIDNGYGFCCLHKLSSLAGWDDVEDRITYWDDHCIEWVEG